jgi:hypothetical protein
LGKTTILGPNLYLRLTLKSSTLKYDNVFFNDDYHFIPNQLDVEGIDVMHVGDGLVNDKHGVNKTIINV